jgi:hypothetical protein
MSYPIEIEGFEGQKIEVIPSNLLSAPKLMINGQHAPKGEKRGQMLLRSNHGQDIIARWKPSGFGLDVPDLLVGDKVVKVAGPLKWYEWVWGSLPVLLIFAGGALGGIAGFIGLSANIKVFRSNQNPVMKYVLTAGISLIAVIVFFILATVFLSIMR